MSISEENILELIPQRDPMVMIDKLLACDDTSAVSELTVRMDNIFLLRNRLTSGGMMEAIAQTAAARTGYLLKNQAETSEKEIPIGVIGSIKNFRMYFQPAVGSVLKTTITVEHEVLQATIIKGKIEFNNDLVAESDMQIFLTGDQDLQS
jgi:predicted hotdog family 3-hydroxylacyl-ACP dehydratase